MSFYLRPRFLDLYSSSFEAIPMYSCTMQSARAELDYVGLEIGWHGLICVEGGRR